MDYERVYREFIADRRRREISLELFETHHVLPRALGGTNEPDNLIRLSLSDHLFAHFLLARIHGGAMAVALVNMLRFKRYRGKRSRANYASLKEAARRYLSEKFMGREVTEKAREKMRQGQLRRCSDPKSRAERDAKLYAPEAVAKAKAGGKSYWDDPARRKAMLGNTRSTGRVLSEIHKARIGAATRAYHARRRKEKQNAYGE